MRFGQYDLLELINRGGMAEVFKALPLQGESPPVAIKRILPALSDDERLVEMLEEEARLVANLDHGNIVQVLDHGRVEGICFLAMELVEGCDLHWLERTLWSDGEQLPLAVTLYVVREILNALSYAHGRCDPSGQPLGIVHRDVSPQNILLSLSGAVKLSDFGIAKAHARAVETTKGVIKGKFRYLAPEQIESRPLDRRCDLFSLGIVLHEMLTGRSLFGGDSPASIMYNILHMPIPRPSEVGAVVAPELDAIVLRVLSRDPDDRFESAEAMREALALHEQPVDPSWLGQWITDLAYRAGAPPPIPDDASGPILVVGDTTSQDEDPTWLVMPDYQKSRLRELAVAETVRERSGTAVDVPVPLVRALRVVVVVLVILVLVGAAWLWWVW